jgi:hypothetical protein
MRKSSWLAMPLLCLSAAGCADKVEALKADTIAEVLTAIKVGVGDYQRSVYDFATGSLADPDSALVAKASTCTKGRLVVSVSKVHIEITTTNDTTTSAGASLSVAIPMTPVALSPSLSGSSEKTNGQTLVFEETVLNPLTLDVMKAASGGHPPFNPDTLGVIQSVHGELWQVLMNFRRGLLAAAGTYPCFTVPKPDPAPGGRPVVAAAGSDKPAANTITLAFTAVRNTDGSIGIKMGIGSFSFGQSEKITAGNTMAVTFNVVTTSGAFLE